MYLAINKIMCIDFSLRALGQSMGIPNWSDIPALEVGEGNGKETHTHPLLQTKELGQDNNSRVLERAR